LGSLEVARRDEESRGGGGGGGGGGGLAAGLVDFLIMTLSRNAAFQEYVTSGAWVTSGLAN
jgi:hypothetical protein